MAKAVTAKLRPALQARFGKVSTSPGEGTRRQFFALVPLFPLAFCSLSLSVPFLWRCFLFSFSLWPLRSSCCLPACVWLARVCSSW